MLQSIRDNTQGWLTSTVIGILILVFGLWGVHGFLELRKTNSDKAIIKIANQTLSEREFNVLYQRFYRQVQARLGTTSPLNEGLANQLKKQTVSQWALMQVLAQSAEQENYRLNQSAVDAALLTMPIFQVSGRFSSTRFYNVLSAMGYTELQFLTELKKTLLIKQVQQGLTETAFSLPHDVNRANALIQQTRDFAYIIIPVQRFTTEKLSVPESQVLLYYEQNKKSFIEPEQVRIDYLKLSLATNNEKKFLEEREELANLTYTHPDSLEIAAKKLGLSIQSSAWFNRTNGKDPLSKNEKVIAAAFSQDVLKGNNSAIIDLDRNTALVLRIKQHKVSTIQPFFSVKAKILQELQKKRATEKTQVEGEALLSQLKEKGSFSDKKNQLNLKWISVNHVERKGGKIDPAVLNTVFNLPPKSKRGPLVFGGVVLANGDYALIKLIAVHAGDSKNLTSEQKSNFSQELAKNNGQLDYSIYMHRLMQKAHLIE